MLILFTVAPPPKAARRTNLNIINNNELNKLSSEQDIFGSTLSSPTSATSPSRYDLY